ncbi:CheY-like chemotaxis protein [Streptacidiphilus sp. MAP12-20]|uniref:response regulator n=1 Tax=Streptacidiphilus sp. MAP12-20 TaxID=3156299 RepID=UPI003514107B
MLTLPRGASIVIADDDRRDAMTAGHRLQDAGYDTTLITEFDPLMDADAFLASLAGKYDALICDYLLSSHGRVGFTGAEVVSKANLRSGAPLPSVLISSHIKPGQQGAISRWRKGIPQVVAKADLDEEILPAIGYTLAELKGSYTRERRAFPTPIEVLEVVAKGEARRARVVVVGWNIHAPVWMPLDPILEETGLRPESLVGQWLEADVNCYASKAEDLYYGNIILSPDFPQTGMPA